MVKLTWMQKIILKQAVKKKIQSFTRAGYQEILQPELLEFLLEYRWKRRKINDLSARLQDLKEVTANDFFDYQQLKIQTSAKTLAELDDFSDLF